MVIRGEASKLLSGDFAMKHEGILPWFNRAKMMINCMTGSNQFRPPNKPHFKYVLFFLMTSIYMACPRQDFQKWEEDHRRSWHLSVWEPGWWLAARASTYWCICFREWMGNWGNGMIVNKLYIIWILYEYYMNICLNCIILCNYNRSYPHSLLSTSKMMDGISEICEC